MSEPRSISEIVQLWPSRAAFRADVMAQLQGCDVRPLTADQVNKWAQDHPIRAVYHQAVVAAAQLRGFPVSAALLARLHAPKVLGA